MQGPCETEKSNPETPHPRQSTSAHEQLNAYVVEAQYIIHISMHNLLLLSYQNHAIPSILNICKECQ